VVDLTFLLGGGGVLGVFTVGGGATSAEDRGDGVFIIVVFDDSVEGCFYV